MPPRLPIFRLQRRFLRSSRLVALYCDGTLIGRLRGHLAEELLEGGALEQLAERCDAYVFVPRNDVVSVRANDCGARRGVWRFCLRRTRGRRAFFVRTDESTNVRAALRDLYGERYVEFRSLWHTWGRGIVIWLAVVAGFVGLVLGLDLVASDASLAVAIVGGLVLFGALVQQFVWFVMRLSRRAIPARRPPSSIPTGAPFRSSPLSVTLKVAALVGLIACVAMSVHGFRVGLPSAYGSMEFQLRYLILVGAYCACTATMQLAYRVGLRPLTAVDLPQGGPKPFVFLRSFGDDDHVSLQPSGFAGYLQGSRGWRRDRRINTDLVSKLTADYTFFQPLRFLRLLFQTPMDTSEEVLAGFFSRWGPVVALGKPGETLATGGAARTYVTHEDWQDVVQSQLSSCQAVVVQPSSSEGVWWELVASFASVPPERILLCLANFANRPDEYEAFGDRFERTFGQRLPRCIPFLRRPAFVLFERDRTPRLQPLEYKQPWKRALAGDATDLDASLTPFVQGIHGGPRELPRTTKSKTTTEVCSAGLQILVNLVLSSALVIPVAVGLFITELATAGAAPVVSEDAPERTEQLELQGGLARVRVPAGWQRLSAGSCEARYGAGRFSRLLLTSSRNLLDADSVTRAIQSSYEQGGWRCSVEEEVVTTRRKRVWTEILFRVTKSGEPQRRERLAVSSHPGGSVFVQGVCEAADSAAIRTVDEAMDSISFTPAAWARLQSAPRVDVTGLAAAWRATLPGVFESHEYDDPEGMVDRLFQASDQGAVFHVSVAPDDGVEHDPIELAQLRLQTLREIFDAEIPADVSGELVGAESCQVGGRSWLCPHYEFSWGGAGELVVLELIGVVDGQLIVVQMSAVGHDPLFAEDLRKTLSTFRVD